VQTTGERIGVLEPPRSGSGLRQRREALGLTLADAERATRVRSRYLEALEEGRLDQLPPGSGYRRVFLRDYALFLGLDPGPLLATLIEERGEAAPPPRRRRWPRRD
jgi:cytoskeleton protein RodZ